MSFYVLAWHLCIVFDEMSYVYILLEFLFSYYWVSRGLYILWIQVFCQICDLQILSPSLYLVSAVAFTYQEFLILMKSNLLNFHFRGNAFDVISKDSLPNQEFLLCFLPKSLIYFISSTFCSFQHKETLCLIKVTHKYFIFFTIMIQFLNFDVQLFIAAI